ncbi:MAG TPA: S-adenosylmethionine:tRNA ribosyltransferase-isomerase [Vicinamibacteria bacterium]|nr:S-adenosylmethionine:tRNA ribosyltransferase-isomerase [Vicinamibacteria bacterium]
MIAARLPMQRAQGAKLLAVDERGHLRHWPRSRFVELLRKGDLVIANDAATLPASLLGEHVPSGRRVEVRLAGRSSLEADDVRHWMAVVFGAGDFRVRTEDRPLPPKLMRGDRLTLGPLNATVEETLGHDRFVWLSFDGSPDEFWQGLAPHGRPIQYAHVTKPLALEEVWTAIAGPPVALEPPSAAFALDWNVVGSMKARGVRFETLTHAAGISSTGDTELDALLPLDEPYWIPVATARAVRETRLRGGRIIAIGTTVARALEHAAEPDGSVRAGAGLATQRIDGSSRLLVIDAILSGTHEPGTSHYELLRAFVHEETLRYIDHELNAHDYRTHEFGDSVFVERDLRRTYRVPMALGLHQDHCGEERRPREKRTRVLPRCTEVPLAAAPRFGRGAAGFHLTPATQAIAAPIDVHPAAVGAGAHPDTRRLVRDHQAGGSPGDGPEDRIELFPLASPGPSRDSFASASRLPRLDAKVRKRGRQIAVEPVPDVRPSPAGRDL